MVPFVVGVVAIEPIWVSQKRVSTLAIGLVIGSNHQRHFFVLSLYRVGDVTLFTEGASNTTSIWESVKALHSNYGLVSFRS
jgi:hypothetical protein